MKRSLFAALIPARAHRRAARAVRAVMAAMVAAALPALAHHGWAWAEDGNSEIAGVIVAAKLGNPHGELTLDESGTKWTVEVGQPWRNARAGLKDEMLAKGTKLKVVGHRHVDPDRKVFKAERVFIDGRRYDLYPDRD
jgi:hypothetical protein